LPCCLTGWRRGFPKSLERALVRRFSVTANSSGQIVIAFTQGAADNPFMSGIEVYAS
jgi:hypothetical protein